LGCTAPKSPHLHAEEDLVSPPAKQDTGASNTGAGTEEAGQAEPLVPPVQKKKKKDSTSSSKAAPESSAPASSVLAKDASEAPAPRKTSMPPPAAPAGEPAPTPSSLVLHTSCAAVVAGETASAQLGRITELTRDGADLGHLLDYAEKWNQEDLSPATRGLEKHKLLVVYPAGPRSTGQHFSWLWRAIWEFDTTWHDANANVVVSCTTSNFLTSKPVFNLMYILSQSPSFGLRM
jgi:hypothetical protein